MNYPTEKSTYGLLRSLLLNISFIIGATIIGVYIFGPRQEIRTASAKGLAERDMTANVRIWPISF